MIDSEASKDILTEQEVAAFLGVKVDTLRTWSARRRGPPRVKFGHVVRYRRSSLMAWFERQEVDPEAARRAVQGGSGRKRGAS